MNAKIYKDGNRIIVSFENVDDSEEVLQRIVRVLSNDEEKVIPDIIPDLEQPEVKEENFEDLFANSSVEDDNEIVIEDFEGMYAGKTPREIMKTPKCEGFYFLCTALRTNKIPSCYINEVKELLDNFIKTKNVLHPPFGNIERMKDYCKMAQNMLGKEEIPDYAYESDDEQWLNTTCRTTCEVLSEFYAKYF